MPVAPHLHAAMFVGEQPLRPRVHHVARDVTPQSKTAFSIAPRASKLRAVAECYTFDITLLLRYYNRTFEILRELWTALRRVESLSLV